MLSPFMKKAAANFLYAPLICGIVIVRVFDTIVSFSKRVALLFGPRQHYATSLRPHHKHDAGLLPFSGRRKRIKRKNRSFGRDVTTLVIMILLTTAFLGVGLYICVKCFLSMTAWWQTKLRGPAEHYATYSQVFEQSSGFPGGSSQPPAEELWLLDKRLPPIPTRIPKLVNKLYFQDDGEFSLTFLEQKNDTKVDLNLAKATEHDASQKLLTRRRLSEEVDSPAKLEEEIVMDAGALAIKEDKESGIKAFKCKDIAAGTYELDNSDLSMNEPLSLCVIPTDPGIKIEMLESLTITQNSKSMDFIRDDAVLFSGITTRIQKDTGVGVETRVPSNIFSFTTGIPASVSGQIQMRLADGSSHKYSLESQVSLAPPKGGTTVTSTSMGGATVTPFRTTSPTIDVASLAEAQKSWAKMNPGYEVRYFSLKMAREYLQTHFHPAFLRTFDCLESFSGKSDFFRAALLYREGGFHSDFKQKLLRPNLLDEIADVTDFFVTRDRGNDYVIKNSCFQTAFIGTTPRHPILRNFLRLLMTNVQSSYYPNNVLFTTGPCALGQAIKDYEKQSGSSVIKEPYFENLMFYWKGQEIIRHKCADCSEGQSWVHGNNYNDLFGKRRFYCEDAESIFV